MQITTSLFLFALGAGSVSARPSHRRHQQFHDKRAVGDIVVATIDGQVVSWVNEYSGETASAKATGASSAVVAATTPTAHAVPVVAVASSGSTASAAAQATASASAGNSGSATTYTPFCSAVVGKRATVQEIAYKGNVGTSSWGCNIQLVDSSIADQYDNTMKFTSQGTDEQACVCWNKIGPDGGNTGAFGNAAVSFNIASGSEQYVALDSNTQGACSCAPNSVPKDSYGEWAGTWVEFDVANESNDGWSGADVSALIPQNAGMTVQGMQVCSSDGQCSSLTGGASNTHLAYVKGMEADDGVGINLVPGKVNFSVIAGYQG